MSTSTSTSARIPKGLTAQQVASRQAKGLTNAYEQQTSRSVWSILRANTFTLFNGIILACLATLLAVGRPLDALFVAIAFLNIVIGSVQEFRTKRTLDQLALLNTQKTMVRRNGVEEEIATDDIVQDDIILLRPGDQVPADGIVVFGQALELDESMLTGESDSVHKQRDDEVLSGSTVAAGRGYVKVTKVGADSYANKLTSEAKRFSLVNSELKNAINKVLRVIAWAIGPLILLVFNSQIVSRGGWLHFSDVWRDAVVAVVASVASMIPLGLVLITSISFTVAAVKLARSKVLVQELPAVEGLARVDMICLDKTGTLTEGVVTYDSAVPLKGAKGDAWRRVLGWNSVQLSANATARALATEFQDVPSDEPTAEVMFSSQRKWSAVSFASSSPEHGTWVLGAPEMILKNQPEDAELMQKIAKHTRNGLRTLLLARSDDMIDEKKAQLPADITPVALVLLREQVRSDARATLAYFAEQGVAVRIVSGDNPETVAAIARSVGLDAEAGFDARFLPEDDTELTSILNEHIVFGRVTPEQKRRIVTVLQAAGHTVAMTGDGVNDALAIKQADMGIAMNSGAAATKAVAQLILLDGRFSHLPKVVAEGRQVIANIEHVSLLFFTKTTYAVGLAVLFGVMLLPFPFIPRQLSIVDSLTIGFPAFFLAMLPNTQRYRPGFLKRTLLFAIPAGLTITLAVVLFARVAATMHIPHDEVRTGATLLLTVLGIWVLVARSRPLTLFKMAIIMSMAILLVLAYMVPIAHHFFQLTDVPFELALVLIAIAGCTIIVIEVIRAIHYRFVGRTLHKPTHRPSLFMSISLLPMYGIALLYIVLGIVMVLLRYDDNLSDSESLVTLIAGVFVILYSFFMFSLVSAVQSGDRPSRIVFTVLAALVVISILAISVSAHDWSVFLNVTMIITALTIAVMWLPRRFLTVVRKEH